MEEIARVYSEALFGAAKDKDKVREIADQLGAVADALDAERDLAIFFFSPYFSSAEKLDGLGRVVTGAEPELSNFLELLLEKHRMPAIFRIRKHFDQLVSAYFKRLEVTVTSAVELDPQVTEHVGRAVAEQTGQEIDLASEVDPEILGGLVLRVGNRVLDASIRTRLEKLKKEVAAAA